MKIFHWGSWITIKVTPTKEDDPLILLDIRISKR